MFKNKSAITKSVINFLLKSSFFGTVGLGLLDLLKYSGFVANHLGLSILSIVGIFATLHLAIRLIFSVNLEEKFTKALIILLSPITLSASLIMYYLEEFGGLFPNYFFSKFGIDLRALSVLSLIFLIFGLINSTKKIWKQNYKVLNIVLTTNILIGALFLYLSQPKFYSSLIGEDGLVEILEVIGFGTAGVLCWQLRKRMSLIFKNSLVQQKIAKFLLLMACIAFTMVVGEEISWGQRVFGFATPENIEAINRQGETNLHNLESIWPFVYWTYLIIGILGASLWLVRYLFKNFLNKNKDLNTWMDLCIPGGYLMLNFVMISIYVLLRQRYGVWRFVAMEELSEVLLSIGISLHLLDNLKHHIDIPFTKK